MSHKAQRDYCDHLKKRFPEFFCNRLVLDVGSLDVNGNNRSLFTDCGYIGIDIAHGPNVDLACKAHEYNPPELFDTIISTDVLEHDVYWERSLQNIVRLLRPEGFLIFTCASPGRKRHGTLQSHPAASPLTVRIEGWCDYYRNLTEDDIREAIDVDFIFRKYEFSVDSSSFDLRFWGIKK